MFKLFCRCHGKGVLEVKCPFNLTTKSFAEMCATPSFCLKEEGGVRSLKTEHEYFYQVQAQMHIAEAEYCDFVVWSPREPMHVERILPDSNFFDSALNNVQQVIKLCILPELVGKIVTVPKIDKKLVYSNSDSVKNGIGCYCCEEDDDDMLLCKSGRCNRVRFHRKCLRLDKTPKTWRCCDCTRLLNNEKREKKKAS